MLFKLAGRKPKSKHIVVIVCALFAVLVFAVLELTNTTHLFRKQPLVASGTAFSTKGEQRSSPKKSSEKNSGSSASSDKSISATVLYVPFGNFVSNHHPNLSGSPAPNTMSSVCNTTPGASCKITFVKDGATKSLSSQTADANGSVYWSWKLQDVGLSAGSWKVQAIASLSGQTKTASDTMDLVVTQ